VKLAPQKNYPDAHYVNSDRPLNETKPARDPFSASHARKPARRK
jgi:hypothetical protein